MLLSRARTHAAREDALLKSPNCRINELPVVLGYVWHIQRYRCELRSIPASRNCNRGRLCVLRAAQILLSNPRSHASACFYLPIGSQAGKIGHLVVIWDAASSAMQCVDWGCCMQYRHQLHRLCFVIRHGNLTLQMNRDSVVKKSRLADKYCPDRECRDSPISVFICAAFGQQSCPELISTYSESLLPLLGLNLTLAAV